MVMGAVSGPFAMGQAADKAWIAKSNAYTQQLLDVQLKHAPERGSRQGSVKFDKLISNPTLADQLEARKELEAVLAKLKAAQTTEKDKNVVQDLEILEKTFNLQFREQDYQLGHNVPFINASSAVFGGLRGLLDDQVAAERRPDAVVRLRK
jgi:DNA-binding FadR family transcriptional regulator